MNPTDFDPGKVLTPMGRALLEGAAESNEMLTGTVAQYPDELRAAIKQALADLTEAQSPVSRGRER